MNSLPFNRVGDLGEYLKEQRQHARLSVRQLASAAGVSNPYLSQIERGLRRPSAEVLQQIAKGLQISAGVLFMRAGLLEESPGVEVETAIQSDVNLSARQKRVLLDIYLTFRAENGRESLGDAAPAVARSTRRGTRTAKKQAVARASRTPSAARPTVDPAAAGVGPAGPSVSPAGPSVSPAGATGPSAGPVVNSVATPADAGSPRPTSRRRGPRPTKGTQRPARLKRD